MDCRVAEHRGLGGVGAAGQIDSNQRGYQTRAGGGGVSDGAEVSDARRYQTRGGIRRAEVSDAREYPPGGNLKPLTCHLDGGV